MSNNQPKEEGKEVVPRTSSAEMQPPPPKKTCIRSREEPDVTIVVGGVEFKEYGQTLRCWSDFFDTALSSGMKEAVTKRFEFPDRDPKEWEWIVSLMSPIAPVTVDKENLPIALSWFDQLSSPIGMKECGGVLN
ncbi:expressed unknown protein [Seminavis robusta]|uniref:BTB domain-containing protein n=1 Tax=Seminavis robusta TaxID=568900 RepID=A0A9N8H6P4_9STRA|nr:expressed unknown protein [Seminavis robusta]|eukprot:Sro106_g053410.1 n/a (134) ;mRNA; r:6090-6491